MLRIKNIEKFPDYIIDTICRKSGGGVNELER